MSSKVTGEVWKPIPNYEGFYEVSNTGKVRSIYRYKRVLKPIAQYTKDGRFIRNWASASECHKETGIATSGIRRVVNGERKSAGGYVFREEG